MYRILSVLCVLWLSGCASWTAQPPIESFVSKLADEAIIPAVRAGIGDGLKNLSLTAGAQGINPTYVITFEGKWVVGIEGRASVGVEGVAGALDVNVAGREE